MNRALMLVILSVCVLASPTMPTYSSEKGSAKKPAPEDCLKMLKEGNARFVAGKSLRPHSDTARVKQAGSENQKDHAYATVLSCSDSRVPVELIFDAGIMDLFVVRVAGNVANVDETGSIEYGLAHVNTPILVVLGHTQCGAVTAVAEAAQGKGHALERNIPPLVAPIKPAVTRAMTLHPEAKGEAIIPYCVEENVWQAIEDLFMKSPAVRDLVATKKAVVVGAIYDVGIGKVDWLPESKVGEILKKVSESPERALNSMAETKH
jgi:carbonic anhydrase